MPMNPGKTMLTNARAIELSKLMEAGTDQPWSSDFWPDMKGSIADPYNETGQGGLGIIPYKRINWKQNDSDLHARASLHQQVVQNINSVDETKFDNMSPSEKYDMIVGDPNFTLTNQVVKMVEDRDAINLVAPFTGVCHGWSPASLTYPRPEHVITLMSPFGRKVNFYPMDVKALASFLWGKSAAGGLVSFDGSKCYSGGHTTHYGRLTDPKCFNVNPAKFHLVTINQIGLNHRGYVFDRSDNGSVWNQPAFAYRAKYFKVTDHYPKTGVTLDQAKVPFNASLQDPYREFRAPGTVSIVGVELTVWYGRENMKPDHTPTDSPKNDIILNQTMRYDLELDAQENIIGGEWREYQDPYDQTLSDIIGYTHPNSIWLVPPTVHATSPGDIYATSAWDGSGTMPQDWRQAAIQYGSTATEGDVNPKTGKLVTVPAPQPLGQVVELLIGLSHKH